MSVQAISWVLEQSESEGKTRCVLISIANHVGPSGEGWVHVDKVCEEARCSVDSYQRAVKWALNAGELAREVNCGGATKVRANRRPNNFRFVKMAPAGRPPQQKPQGSASCPPPAAEQGSAELAPQLVQAPADCPPQKPQDAHPKALSRGPQDAHPEPSLLKHEPSKEPSVTPSFEDFYATYPRHVGPRDARKAWDEVTKDADPSEIMAGAERYALERLGKDPRYTKHPGPWLRAHRWLDEPDPHFRELSPSMGNIQRALLR